MYGTYIVITAGGEIQLFPLKKGIIENMKLNVNI
jgi:hypothetical protein